MEQKTQATLIVKVSFRKAIFNLGKNIKTYSHLIDQVHSRFPQLKQFSITFNESPLTSQNFQTIFVSQLNQPQTSIKFQIHQLPLQQAVESKPSKSKKFSFDPKEFEDDKESPKKSQPLKELESQFQELEIGQNQKIPELANEIDLSSIKIKVLVGSSVSNQKKEVGEQYKWSCNIINQATTDVPQGIYIRQIATNKLISLGGMGAKEAQQIEFGPYVQKEMGKFTRFYQIVYKKNEQTFVPIGNKFGFVCEASKKLDVKELSSKVYKKINELKSFSASQKSTEYIMAKFKEMGIDDSSIRKYYDEDLIDIMESFNINE